MAKKITTLTLEDQPAELEPAPTNKIGLTDKVATKSGEFTVQELLEAQHQLGQVKGHLQQYEEYRKAVQNLLNPDVEDPAVRTASLRHVLSAEGYSPAEIERQVQMLTNGVDSGSAKPPAAADADEDVEEADEEIPPAKTRSNALDNEFQTLQSQLAEQEKETNRIRVQLLKKEMAASVGSVLDSDPEVAKLVKKVKELNPDDSDKRVQYLREDIEKKAVEQLSKKVALTGQRVREDWVDEAVKQAATEVRQRSLFGNPDAIGRAATVDSSSDRFENRKPVPPPSFDKGDSMATVGNKVKAFGTDLLSRLAAQANPGDSKA